MRAVRIFLRILVIAIVLVVGYVFLGPGIERAMYTVRLAAMDKPTALPVPVEGDKPRALRDTWGGARSEGRRHEGIDIFA